MEATKNKYQDTRDFLNTVRKCGNRVDALVNRINYRKSLLNIRTSHYSNMPKAPRASIRPMEDHIADLDALEYELKQAMDEYLMAKIQVSDLIGHLECSDQQLVMQKRYVDQKSWEEISQDMQYSVRWVQKLHGKALPILDAVWQSAGFSADGENGP